MPIATNPDSLRSREIKRALKVSRPIFTHRELLLSPFCLLGSARLPRRRRDQPQCSAFVDRYVVGFVTGDEVLGCVP